MYTLYALLPQNCATFSCLLLNYFKSPFLRNPLKSRFIDLHLDRLVAAIIFFKRVGFKKAEL